MPDDARSCPSNSDWDAIAADIELKSALADADVLLNYAAEGGS